MIKKYFRIIIASLYILTIFNFSFAKDYKEIKVGFYNIENEMEEDYYGNKSGYNYYYLQQMKKYSNFKYKYICGTWNECEENLANGNIDIIAGMIKTKEREKKFDFSKYSIGMLEGVMVVSSEHNYNPFDFKTIGAVKGEFLGIKYREITKKNNYKNKIVYYDTYKELWDDFYRGKIDGALTYSSSISSIEGKDIKIVDYFDPQFTYIAVKNGNKNLLESINESIKTLKKYNKNTIKNYKYTVSKKNDQVSLFFNHEEKKELDNLTKIIFISPSERGYFNYKKNGKTRGIDYDLAKLICDKLNVELDYKVVDGYLNAEEIKKLGKNIVICGNYFDMNWAEKNNLNLTAEYLKRRYYKIRNSDEIIYSKNKLKVAAIKNNNFTNLYIKRNFKPSTIHYYNNVKECLDAVYSEKCDITYCDYLVGNFYFSSYKYKKLFKEYISFENMSSFVLNENSSLFNSIINKTISSINDTEISQIVSNNLDYKLKNSYLLNWIYLNPIESFIIGIIVIFSILHFIYHFRINRKNKLIQRVTALSKKDSMTKLYNRDTFEEIVTKLLVSENVFKYSAFIMMDIDSFKSINDTYGHFIGDKVIIKVTNLLKKSFKYSDILGRMGGDEFAIFIYNIDRENHINSKIERLIVDINNCMMEEKDEANKIIVKCSFGITFIKEEKKTFEKIYKEADDALYKAKSDGKNKYVIYNKDNIRK